MKKLPHEYGIHFALCPVRVVQPTEDPVTCVIDGARQTFDFTETVTEAGLTGVVYRVDPVEPLPGGINMIDEDDLISIRSILRAISAEREACAQMADEREDVTLAMRIRARM